MSRLVSYVRSLRATPLGRYIPGNKVLGGALAGLASTALVRAGLVDVPPLYVSLGTFALVSYLLPESPVAAAHTLARGIKFGDTGEGRAPYATVTKVEKVRRTATLVVVPAPEPKPAVDPTAIQAGVQPPVVPPQSA